MENKQQEVQILNLNTPIGIGENLAGAKGNAVPLNVLEIGCYY